MTIEARSSRTGRPSAARTRPTSWRLGGGPTGPAPCAEAAEVDDPPHARRARPPRRRPRRPRGRPRGSPCPRHRVDEVVRGVDAGERRRRATPASCDVAAHDLGRRRDPRRQLRRAGGVMQAQAPPSRSRRAQQAAADVAGRAGEQDQGASGGGGGILAARHPPRLTSRGASMRGIGRAGCGSRWGAGVARRRCAGAAGAAAACAWAALEPLAARALGTGDFSDVRLLGRLVPGAGERWPVAGRSSTPPTARPSARSSRSPAGGGRGPGLAWAGARGRRDVAGDGPDRPRPPRPPLGQLAGAGAQPARDRPGGAHARPLRARAGPARRANHPREG